MHASRNNSIAPTTTATSQYHSSPGYTSPSSLPSFRMEPTNCMNSQKIRNHCKGSPSDHCSVASSSSSSSSSASSFSSSSSSSSLTSPSPSSYPLDDSSSLLLEPIAYTPQMRIDRSETTHFASTTLRNNQLYQEHWLQALRVDDNLVAVANTEGDEDEEVEDILMQGLFDENDDNKGSNTATDSKIIDEHLEPTPIGPDGVINIVDKVCITNNHWHQNQEMIDMLNPLFFSTEPSSPSSKPYVTEQNCAHAARTVNKKTPALMMQESSKKIHQPSSDNVAPSLFKVEVASSSLSLSSSSSTGSFAQEEKEQKPKSSLLQSDQWAERLHELVQYHAINGHCNVPHNWTENVGLAQWVKRQRHQYKLKNEKKRSTLTDERQAALDELGFVWDSHGSAWEERWNELRDFRDTHGHCNVPTNFPENPQLSVWVKCQRRQFKLFWTGRKSHITRARIARLVELGFVWNPRKHKGSINRRTNSQLAIINNRK